jgi:DNA-binding XRE family transcriptional regulator
MNEWLTITEARKRLKLTQKGLAKAVGTTDREIRRYEYHERGEGGKPAPDVIRSRANRLLGPKYILGEGYVGKDEVYRIIRLHPPAFVASGFHPSIWLDPPETDPAKLKEFESEVYEIYKGVST